MDEERIYAYLALIKALQTCSSRKEEEKLLQANSELVDVGLVQIMEGVAQRMEKEEKKRLPIGYYSLPFD